MRIAQFVESLAIGGLERVAVDLATGLKSRRHESFVYCVCADGPLVTVANQGGVTVRSFHKPAGFSARAVGQIVRQLLADRIDLVHTHNSVIHHYGAVARLFGIPVVNTAHGLGVVKLPARQIKLFRVTMPLTETVVFVADDARRCLWDAGGFRASKARVIQNGIRTAEFTAKSARPGSRRPRIRFGTVGRLVPVKDHLMLLRAFATVAPRLPAAELYIAGYGTLEQQIRETASSLGIGGRFQLLPGDTNIPEFLSGLDVFVISSQMEGLPVSVLEAMAAGLPLVSTKVGGIPDVAPEGSVAWYAPPGNAEALAKAMEQCAASSDLFAPGRRAAQIVQDSFRLETMVRAYEDLYCEVLGGKPDHAGTTERI